ncbi:MAG TPA: hypothetical protein VFH54_00715 [Mycobacteriales bacterium]|nr:hypothetical protein [Mycobacteriales bacterium]
MTEPDDDGEVMILRSVTVSEVMDREGTRILTVHTDGEPELWDMLGMLTAGVESVRFDLSRTWAINTDTDDTDDD